MSKKCCRSDPPCKDCPKHRKKRKKANAAAGICPLLAENQAGPRRTGYLTPVTLMSISGQRGCTANSPAGLA